jgi:3-phosphoshikimate 1-carboxyvinyltransferase
MKSISNRALLLASLARGTTMLEGVLDSDDTRVMREALEAVGVPIETLGDARRLRIHGTGAGTGLPIKKAEIFVGNSGTTMRSLAAVLALADGNYEVRGVERMHERPIGDLVGALRWLGARIEWLGKTGYPPLAIGPREHPSPGSRARRPPSQFVSAVLMALPWAKTARVEVEGT